MGASQEKVARPSGSPGHLEQSRHVPYAFHPETGTKPIRIACVHSHDISYEKSDRSEEPFLFFPGEAKAFPNEHRMSVRM